ncbi:MAG: hypothetical protein R2706_01215 [Acidimicrobiales bacterium]
MPTTRSSGPTRRQLSGWALGAWTLFVWVGRVRNIAVDNELVGTDRAIRFVLAASFVALGLLVIGGLVSSRRSRQAVSWLPAALAVLAGYSMVTWVIRGIDISFAGDHPTGFIIVHAVLAIVTIGLSAWVVRDLRSAHFSSTQPSDARISA